MGYADHLRSSSSTSQRPNCWGYDPNDIECGECRFRHSCRAEVERNGHAGGGGVGTPIPVNRGPSSYSRPYRRNDDVDAGNYEPGLVAEGEKPIERFVKDAAGGALRGMFYEMWQFWKNYRIR